MACPEEREPPSSVCSRGTLEPPVEFQPASTTGASIPTREQGSVVALIPPTRDPQSRFPYPENRERYASLPPPRGSWRSPPSGSLLEKPDARSRDDLRIGTCRSAVKWQDAFPEQAAECPFAGCLKALASSALGQEGHAGGNLGFGDRRPEQFPAGPAVVHPVQIPDTSCHSSTKRGVSPCRRNPGSAPAGGPASVEPDTVGRESPGHRRLVACPRPLDQHCSGSGQTLLQFPIRDTGPVLAPHRHARPTRHRFAHDMAGGNIGVAGHWAGLSGSRMVFGTNQADFVST